MKLTKRELAESLAVAARSVDIEDNALTNLAAIISNAFSAIGTISPKIALDVLAQLNDSESDLKRLAQKQEDHLDDLASEIAMTMPDTIEFEEEYNN